MNSSARRGALTNLLLVLAMGGCSTKYYRKSADKETYQAIQAKTPLVNNMDPRFTIEQTNALSLDGLPISTNAPEFLGTDAEFERGATILKLEDALGVGIHQSRLYQARKEQLYMSGLSLTLVRHQYAPLFSAVGDARYEVQTEQALRLEIDEITGLP